MGGKDYTWTESRFKRYIQEGRGLGELREYRPWLEVDDVPSTGQQHKKLGWKTNREHHLLSNLEEYYFYILEWTDDVVDIREQYPLDFEETEQICNKKSIKHPVDNKTQVIIPFTTDFFITVRRNKNIEYVARTVKQSVDLEDERNLEKFEVEREYYARKGIDWGIVTEKDIPNIFVLNIQDFHGYSRLEQEFKEYKELFMQYFIESPQNYSIVDITSRFDTLYNLSVGSALSIFKHFLAQKRIIIVDMFSPISFRIQKKNFKVSCRKDKMV
ncbi:TnsA endonuclease N-terminal domain-containing protein [Bacillus toyonensis]|uniref:TnsA endonuclease N-terminal domain-containing protein n=1 Tax=Bacillus toyonensis TaxID=155322 RepID=UPI0036B4F588